MKNIIFISAVLLSIFTSCKKDKAIQPNLNINQTNTVSSDTITESFDIYLLDVENNSLYPNSFPNSIYILSKCQGVVLDSLFFNGITSSGLPGAYGIGSNVPSDSALINESTGMILIPNNISGLKINSQQQTSLEIYDGSGLIAIFQLGITGIIGGPSYQTPNSHSLFSVKTALYKSKAFTLK